MKTRNRLLALLLALLLLVSLLPGLAAAEGDDLPAPTEETGGGEAGAPEGDPPAAEEPPAAIAADDEPAAEPDAQPEAEPGNEPDAQPEDEPAPAPVITRQPENAPVNNGEAVFSVEAAAAEGEPCYQWQRLDVSAAYAGEEARESAWAELDGETGSTLRLIGLDDPDALRAAAAQRWRCRVYVGGSGVSTHEVCLDLPARDYDSTTITGFAALTPDELTQEYKSALVVLKSEVLPKELAVFLGGSALYTEDGALLAFRDGVPATLPVTWICLQDYDEDLDVFDFVPAVEGCALAEGLTPPVLHVHAGELRTGPLSGHIPTGIKDVPIVGSRVRGAANDSYNAYELGLLPRVRDQGSDGACWAFAAIGSLEADMIHDGLADTNVNLSELHLAYYTTHKVTALRNSTADRINCSISRYLDNGGNNYLSLRTLANGVGPVSEADAPYPNGSPNGSPVAQLGAAYIINSEDIPAIKSAIRAHGAVDAAIYYSSSYYSSTHNSYYSDWAFPNHEVMLVGWDDNFSRMNFRQGVPPGGDGAWLVRNSWGLNNYGSSGYFWLSYYDKGLLGDVITAYDVEPRRYTYCYSPSSIPFPDEEETLAANATLSQSYVLAGDEVVRAVGFETLSGNLSGTVTVSAAVDGSERSSSAPIWTTHAGFYYIALNTPLSLPRGTEVTVSLQFDKEMTVSVEGQSGRSSSVGSVSYIASCDGGGISITDEAGEVTNKATDARIMLYTDPGAADTPEEVSAVTLDKTSLTLTCGDYEQLTATVLPETADNRALSWISSDPAVATVLDGIVTAVSPGTADITVYTRNGKSAVCTVTVKGIPVTGLRLTGSFEEEDGQKVLYNDDSQFELANDPEDPLDLSTVPMVFSYQLLPANATNKRVIWESSDPDVIYADPDSGDCRIRGNGSALLTVTAEDTEAGVFSDSIRITINLSAYTVRFDANGGTGAPEAQAKYRFIPLTIPDTEPTSEGLVFQGWAVFPTLEAQYQPGDQYVGNTDVTLYAIWAPALSVDPAELSGAFVSVDGVTCPVDESGTILMEDTKTAKVIEAFTYHDGDSEDPHSRYPTGMKVWVVKEDRRGRRTVERLDALDDILQYSGFSIRITGKRGIRMITSIPTERKKALISAGIAGYRLEEYGTIVAWADALDGSDLTMDNAAGRAYAYKRGVADPVFRTVNGLSQYTNVLVNFTDEQIVSDLVMRSYMILSAGGERIVLYGGAVQRSIGYVACQNRSAFSPGTASYAYVWELIHIGFGDAYDEDYHG